MGKFYLRSLKFPRVVTQAPVFSNHTLDSLKLSRVLIPIRIVTNCTCDSLNLHIELPKCTCCKVLILSMKFEST